MGVGLMPATWTKGSPQEFINMGDRIYTQLYNELSNAMGVIVMAAVQNSKEYTAERGRPSSFGSGRIETSEMIGAIKGDVELKAKEIIGKFGFLDQQANYFLYQTVTGFSHYLSGDFIEPTFALRDAEILAESDVVEAIKAAIRNVRL